MKKNNEKEIVQLQKMSLLLDDKKAEDILLLDITECSNYMSYFLIATCLTASHSKSLTNELVVALNREGNRLVRTFPPDFESGWVALDYGYFVIHLFTKEKRDYYELEKLWQRGKVVPWSQPKKLSLKEKSRHLTLIPEKGNQNEIRNAEKYRLVETLSTDSGSHPEKIIKKEKKKMTAKKPAKKAAKKAVKKPVKKAAKKVVKKK